MFNLLMKWASWADGHDTVSSSRLQRQALPPATLDRALLNAAQSEKVPPVGDGA